MLANKRSVVVSFSERFAVFDAGTLEDRMAVTTCFPCPCPLGGSAPINPLALGDRWLAYADKKLNQSKRSSGGCESKYTVYYGIVIIIIRFVHNIYCRKARFNYVNILHACFNVPSTDLGKLSHL